MEVFGLHAPQARQSWRKERGRAVRNVRRERDRDEEPHAGTLERVRETGGLDLVADEHRQESDRKKRRECPQRDEPRRFASERSPAGSIVRSVGLVC